jgi:ABC-type nickel/cobalt efflux system permease component RcnA
VTAARAVGAAYPLLLAAALLIAAGLWVSWRLQDRRRAARAAERHARPHSTHVGTAEQDAAALAMYRLTEEQQQ